MTDRYHGNSRLVGEKQIRNVRTGGPPIVDKEIYKKIDKKRQRLFYKSHDNWEIKDKRR